jgi:hypothetical protein
MELHRIGTWLCSLTVRMAAKVVGPPKKIFAVFFQSLLLFATITPKTFSRQRVRFSGPSIAGENLQQKLEKIEMKKIAKICKNESKTKNGKIWNKK